MSLSPWIGKTITGIKDMLTPYTGRSSSTDNQAHRDEANQADIIHSERDKYEVVKTDNAHVSENFKTSSGHDRTGSTLNAHYQSLINENASLKMQLDEEQHHHAQTTNGSKELRKKFQKLMGEKEDLQANIEARGNDFFREKMGADKQIRDLQGKNQKLEEELKILKGTLRGLQEKHLHMAKLLEERTADLKGAQTFLTTVDRYAGAEIMKMVEALNAEIFQGAALISELLGDGSTILTVDRQRKAEDLAHYIGPELAEHLSTKSKQVQADPLPLQLAVQAILTNWCVVMINKFCLGPVSDDLKKIYRGIWESEPQAVAGRWRAMTIRQGKHLDSTTHEDTAIQVLFTLLSLSGSPMANLDPQKTVLCLRQVVSTIMHMWMPLRIAIYEGTTTTEMQVFDVRPDEIYQATEMENIYADTEDVLGKGERRTLCAVGMGLQRCIKRNSDGTMSTQKDITLKAKVAFPSVLFDTA